MSVRPNLTQVIGCSVNKKENYQTWINDFNCNLWTEEFITYTMDIWKSLEKSQEFLNSYLKKFVHTELGQVASGYDDIFGISPVMHFDDSELYGHDLLYAMVEAGVIDKKFSIKIPYKDFSQCMGKSVEENAESMGFIEARVFEDYRGDWARQYANHQMYYFDFDFNFAYALLNKFGFSVEKKDLDRYLIFSWE
jgi:hypothetical protein